MTWYALKSIDHAAWNGRSPWAGKRCRLICEGHGPGPHNVLVKLEDGKVLITIRRDKSLRTLYKRERQVELF